MWKLLPFLHSVYCSNKGLQLLMMFYLFRSADIINTVRMLIKVYTTS